MTRAQFAAKAQQLEQEYGITIQSDSGTLSSGAHTASYVFDGKQLQVKSLDKNFLVRHLVESDLKGWLGV
jgi:hypothetical protein